MSRVTRSRVKAANKEAIENPNYAEPGSDIEDLEETTEVKKEVSKRSRKSSNVQPSTSKPKSRSKKKDIDGDDNDYDPNETKLKIEAKPNIKDDKVEDDEYNNIDYELSEKELKQINKAFDMNQISLTDENLGSGNLKTAMRHLGYEPRAEEIKRLMNKFSNSKAKINRDGFHKLMAYKYSTSPGMNDKTANDEISKVFNLFDINKTGKISLENLKSIAKELNEVLTDEELLEMITEADEDKDSFIDKIEFQNIMKKTSLY